MPKSNVIDIKREFKPSKSVQYKPDLFESTEKFWANVATEGETYNGFVFTPEFFSKFIQDFYKSDAPGPVYRGHEDSDYMNGLGAEPPASGYVLALDTRENKEGKVELWAYYELLPETYELVKSGKYQFNSIAATLIEQEDEDELDVMFQSIALTNKPAGQSLIQMAASKDKRVLEQLVANRNKNILKRRYLKNESKGSTKMSKIKNLKFAISSDPDEAIQQLQGLVEDLLRMRESGEDVNPEEAINELLKPELEQTDTETDDTESDDTENEMSKQDGDNPKAGEDEDNSGGVVDEQRLELLQLVAEATGQDSLTEEEAMAILIDMLKRDQSLKRAQQAVTRKNNEDFEDAAEAALTASKNNKGAEGGDEKSGALGDSTEGNTGDSTETNEDSNMTEQNKDLELLKEENRKLKAELMRNRVRSDLKNIELDDEVIGDLQMVLEKSEDSYKRLLTVIAAKATQNSSSDSKSKIKNIAASRIKTIAADDRKQTERNHLDKKDRDFLAAFEATPWFK